MEPIISVIVPVYNVEEYVADCVDSIIRQTVTDIEIILIDDCARDGSGQRCRELAQTDSRIAVYRHPENRGVSAARNTGLAHASGTYVYFADADDRLDPDTLEHLLGLMEQDAGVDLAVCGFYTNDIPQKEKKTNRNRRFDRLETARAIAGENGILVKGYLWNKLFRRSIIAENHLRFDESFAVGEDKVFCYSYVLHAGGSFYSAEPKYHYMVRSGSAMHSGLTQKYVKADRANEAVIRLGEHYQDTELNQLLRINQLSFYVTCLKLMMTSDFAEHLDFGDRCMDRIRGDLQRFLSADNIPLKRKVLTLYLLLVYPAARRKYRKK